MGPTRRSCPSVYANRRDMAVAEEAEASERLRRPRGRPRRGPLTDHGRSSSRDPVHDDDLQHTVDGDGVHGWRTRRRFQRWRTRRRRR